MYSMTFQHINWDYSSSIFYNDLSFPLSTFLFLCFHLWSDSPVYKYFCIFVVFPPVEYSLHTLAREVNNSGFIAKTGVAQCLIWPWQCQPVTWPKCDKPWDRQFQWVLHLCLWFHLHNICIMTCWQHTHTKKWPTYIILSQIILWEIICASISISIIIWWVIQPYLWFLLQNGCTMTLWQHPHT